MSIDERRALRATSGSGPIRELVRAVDGDEHALADVLRQLAAAAPSSAHELVLARQRRVAREIHHDVLAELVAARASSRAASRARRRPGSRASSRGSGRARGAPPRLPARVSSTSSSGASSSISWSFARRARPSDRIRRSAAGFASSCSSRASRDCSTPCAASSPLQRPRALALGAEHADEHARLPEVGRRLDAGDRDEADPRVLQLGAPPRRAPAAPTRSRAASAHSSGTTTSRSRSTSSHSCPCS